MSSEWKNLCLGEQCERVTKGTTPTTAGGRFTETGINFIKVESIGNDGQIQVDKLAAIDDATDQLLTRSRIRPGDILFTIAGTIGRVCLFPENLLPANTNQAVAIIRLRENAEVDRTYLYYALRSEATKTSVAAGVVQAVQANFSLGGIKKLEIMAPSYIEEQRRIARYLKSLDDKIQLNHQINQSLEKIAQATFKSWFVDFEPVKAKIAAQEAGGSEEDALLAAVQAISGKGEVELTRLQAEQPEQYAELRAIAELFPSAMQDSELGEIPEGWNCTNLENLCTTVTKGTTPKKTEIAEAIDDAVVRFIKVKDITGTGEIIRKGLELIPDSISRKSLKRSILKDGDLLFSIAGTIGRIAIVDTTLEDSNTNQAVGIIRLREQEKYLSVVWQTLLSDRIQNEIRFKVVQGVQANASLKNLRDIQVILPSTELLDIASSDLSALLKKIVSNHAQSRNLTELRDTLLPKLLSGELSVSDTEDHLAETAEPADV